MMMMMIDDDDVDDSVNVIRSKHTYTHEYNINI